MAAIHSEAVLRQRVCGAKSVAWCFSSVRTAIAAIAMAASNAPNKLASNSGVGPIPGANRARKAGSIIATGSNRTGAAGKLNFP
jgi:hypothetical protein